MRNKKHQLKNDLLCFMEEKELMWPEKEVSDVGEVFVQSLVDLLWYIDNHHSTLNERSHKVPPIFDRFSGYNMPQAHKHRKRSADNLSSILLTDYSNKLFKCLQSCYWERSIWRNFKTDVEMLAKSAHDYASYLRDQNKRMKAVHCSMSPIRSMADNISFQVLPVSNSVPSLLNELEMVLLDKGMFDFVSVESVCPQDARKKYEYMSLLKRGLSVRTAKLTYSHGNSVGNLNFIWKIPSAKSDSDILSESACD